jgi:hypothetical protein
MEPEPTQHNSLDKLQTKKISTTLLFVNGYNETDTTGMLSHNNGRMSGANEVGLFQADSLARHLLQCA